MGAVTICLTGGIASGKTFVSDFLLQNQAAVIDADVVAREVVQVGRPVLIKLKDRFGCGVLNKDGSLNRPELKRVAFSSPENTADLNQILHPVIGAEMERQINCSKSMVRVLVIPLFKPAMIAKYGIDRVLLVDVAKSIQLERVMSRDGIDESLAKSIMLSQSTRKERLAFADDVIVNNSSFDKLREHARSIHAFYHQLTR